MDISEARKQLAKQQITVNDVLSRYVDQHGCPCDWPQFEYWVGKLQGPGWQDNIQNDLVEISRKLPCFYRPPSRPAEYGSDSSITCSKCRREWRYSSEEWRMLAYHERLIPLKPSNAATTFSAAVGANFFATVGFEPNNTRLLTLTEWAEFMLGEPYGPTPCTPVVSNISQGSQSLAERVIAWLKGRT